MNLVKFAWVLLYILGVLIDYASRPSFFVGSMIAILPRSTSASPHLWDINLEQ